MAKKRSKFGIPNARELMSAYGMRVPGEPDQGYSPMGMTPNLTPPMQANIAGPRAQANILRQQTADQQGLNQRYRQWQADTAAAGDDYEAAQQRVREMEPAWREQDLAKAFGRQPRFGPTAPPRFGPGEYQQYQQGLGVNTNPAPTPPSAEDVSRIQGIVGASPARQFREAMAARAPATRFVDGQGYMPNARPAYGTGGGGVLPDTQAGVGMQTSGVGSGGRMGTPLMRGGLPPAATPRPEIQSRPMIGGKATTPEEFQAAWDKRQAATRTAPDGNPERIAASQAAMQRMHGGAPIVTDPAQRQAMWEAERARKEMTKYGAPRDFARAWAANRDNPEMQAAMVESMRRPMVARGTRGGGGWDEDGRGGSGVAGVVGAQAAAALARQKLGLDERTAANEERSTTNEERKTRAILQQQGAAAYQTTYDRLIGEGKTPAEARTMALQAAAQASDNEFQEYGTGDVAPPETGLFPADSNAGAIPGMYEEHYGLPAWTGAVGLGLGAPAGPAGVDLVNRAMSWAFGSPKRKSEARQRRLTRP